MATQKQVKLIEKTFIKANGVTLYQFQSNSEIGKQYFITAKNGVIDAATHTDCDGFFYRGTCAHTAYIMQDIYDVQAAATQVVADVVVGDAYEHISYTPVARRLTEAEETARCNRDIFWGEF